MPPIFKLILHGPLTLIDGYNSKFSPIAKINAFLVSSIFLLRSFNSNLNSIIFTYLNQFHLLLLLFSFLSQYLLLISLHLVVVDLKIFHYNSTKLYHLIILYQFQVFHHKQLRIYDLNVINFSKILVLMLNENQHLIMNDLIKIISKILLMNKIQLLHQNYEDCLQSQFQNMM